MTKYKIKTFYSKTTGPISTLFGTKHLGVNEIQVCTMKGPPISIIISGDNKEIKKYINRIFQKSSSPEPQGQTWHKAFFGEEYSSLFKSNDAIQSSVY